MTVTLHATASVHRSLRQRSLSFPVLLASVVATCVFLFVPRTMADPDIWWHLRNAEYQIAIHSFITRDMYSFTTSGAPWMDHEWLAEVPFYLGWRVMGSRGLFLVTAMALECIFLGVFYLAGRHAKNPKAALLPAVIASFLATISFGPRTLLFGWICLVAELLILERYFGDSPRAFRKVLWMLPLLFGIWVNTHGSWIIGMVVLIGFLACGCFRISVGAIENKSWTRDQFQVLAGATSLSLASVFLNPYGWRLVAYPFNLAFRQKLNIANVDEWVTLDCHSVRGHVFLVSLTLVFFAQLVRSRKWAVYELFFLFVGVYSAFTYSRFLFLASILIFPLIAKDLAWVPAYCPEQNKPRLNGVILCVLMGVCVHHFLARAEEQASGDHPFPDHALVFLHAFQPQGNVLNDYLWGGYLEWHARQIPIFIDSRVDIFEYAGIFKDYLDLIRLKDSLKILDKYKIRYVLFERDAPLVYLLQQTHAWKIDYQDKSTILLERVNAPVYTATQILSTINKHR